MEQWKKDIDSFLILAKKYNVRMLMVGGAAVNFHGYQRHSADVDFWIDPQLENFSKLIKVFVEMEYDLADFPEEVKSGMQNISIKFSPHDLNLDLITNFSVNKSFDQAYEESTHASMEDERDISWRVLSLDDLIVSKTKSGRPKDLSDIQQLKKINKL